MQTNYSLLAKESKFCQNLRSPKLTQKQSSATKIHLESGTPTCKRFLKNTLDGSEIPFPTTWDGAKNPVTNGITCQPQLVLAGFLPSTVSPQQKSSLNECPRLVRLGHDPKEITIQKKNLPNTLNMIPIPLSKLM